MADEIKPISKKHQRFIDEWLQCFNGTEAYLRVYPKATRETARANASDLLAKTNIKAEIEDRLKAVHMSADEALKLQSDIARGDITELLTPLGSVDIDYIREKGLGRLIKKIKVRTITKIGKGDKDDDTEIHDTELEMYPADAAQERILKVGGKLKPENQTVIIRLGINSDEL